MTIETNLGYGWLGVMVLIAMGIAQRQTRHISQRTLEKQTRIRTALMNLNGLFLT